MTFDGDFQPRPGLAHLRRVGTPREQVVVGGLADGLLHRLVYVARVEDGAAAGLFGDELERLAGGARLPEVNPDAARGEVDVIVRGGVDARTRREERRVQVQRVDHDAGLRGRLRDAAQRFERARGAFVEDEAVREEEDELPPGQRAGREHQTLERVEGVVGRHPTLRAHLPQTRAQVRRGRVGGRQRVVAVAAARPHLLFDLGGLQKVRVQLAVARVQHLARRVLADLRLA